MLLAKPRISERAAWRLLITLVVHEPAGSKPWRMATFDDGGNGGCLLRRTQRRKINVHSDNSRVVLSADHQWFSQMSELCARKLMGRSSGMLSRL
jgi:hypothetical protein